MYSCINDYCENGVNVAGDKCYVCQKVDRLQKENEELKLRLRKTKLNLLQKGKK